MKSKKKIDLGRQDYIVTTSLPYVNSVPHVGFALETFVADSTARFLRLLGKNVLFVTGTEDNSFKLALKPLS